MVLGGLDGVRRSTTTQQAYDAVLEAILDGRLPADTRLGLQDLSTKLGMSMMPIREAIRQLEAVGVVEQQPHRGARVRPVSADDLEDSYRTRILLEGNLCRQAAAKFDTDSAQDAREALESQHYALTHGDVPAAREAHKRFHYAIYRAADSMWMLRAIEPVWNNSERYRGATMIEQDVLTIRRREHEAILQACIEHAPERAEDALRAHLVSTVKHLDPAVAAKLTADPA